MSGYTSWIGWSTLWWVSAWVFILGMLSMFFRVGVFIVMYNPELWDKIAGASTFLIVVSICGIIVGGIGTVFIESDDE